jgi:hypothetical protein
VELVALRRVAVSSGALPTKIVLNTHNHQRYKRLDNPHDLHYRTAMSTVAEIRNAIEGLSLRERGELAKWFNGWEDDDWDKGMARDFAPGGRLSKLKAQVQKKAATAPLLDLP